MKSVFFTFTSPPSADDIQTTESSSSSSTENVAHVTQLKTTFFALSAMYALLGVIPLIQLIRINLTGFPIRRITTQKTFLFLLLLTCIFRFIFFIIIPFSDESNTFDLGKFSIESFTVLDDLGCLIFFTTFSLLIMFWIEIVYHSRNKTRVYRAKVRPIFFITTALIYLVQIVIWVLLFALPSDTRDLMDKIDNIFYSTISLCAGLGFCYYGIKLSIKLKRNPINSSGKRRKLIEVIIFTVLCTISFLSRSVLFFMITFFSTAYKVNSLTIAIYYAVSEIIPSIFVIILFRKMPPRPALTPTYRVNVGRGSTIEPDYFKLPREIDVSPTDTQPLIQSTE